MDELQRSRRMLLPRLAGLLAAAAGIMAAGPWVVQPARANALPRIAVGDVRLSEGDTGGLRSAAVPVTLSKASNLPVKVTYTITSADADKADCPKIGKSGKLTIKPGLLFTTLSLPLKPDQLDESDETLTITLSAPLNADLGRDQGRVLIRDDDSPGESGNAINIGGAVVVEGDEGTRVVGLQLSLEEPASSDVVVTLLQGGTTKSVTLAKGKFRATVLATSAPGNTTLDPDDVSTVALTSTAGPVVAGSFTLAGVRTLDDDGTSSVVGEPVLGVWGYADYGEGGAGTAARVGFPRPPMPTGATGGERIALGSNFALAVRAGGQLWSWGSNFWGELGRDYLVLEEDPAPKRVEDLTGWSAVAAGHNHAAAIRQGMLFTWGRNEFGELGLGTTDVVGTPTRVGTATDWAAVAAGGGFTLALRTDGSLWAFGRNLRGQLGIGTTSDSSVPVKVGNQSWTRIAAGQAHALAIRADGTLWAWGSNQDGILGLGQPDGDAHVIPVQVGTATDWISIAAGAHHSIGIRSSVTGTSLWGWGDNSNGQTGGGWQPSYWEPEQVTGGPASAVWADVATGGDHTLARTASGEVYSFGSYFFGAAGTGCCYLTWQTYDPHLVPTGGPAQWIAGGANTSAAITTSGALELWGMNSGGLLGTGRYERVDWADGGVPFAQANFRDIEAGEDSSFAITEDGGGTLWAWGNNVIGGWDLGFQYASLGLGDGWDRMQPEALSGSGWRDVEAGRQHTLALKDDGTLWAFGSDQNGQLGTNGADLPGTLVPVQVGAASDWADIAAGNCHSLAVKTNGTLWAWGCNLRAALGAGFDEFDDEKAPTQVGTATTWVEVEAAGVNSYALDAAGHLWAWGQINDRGQLGVGDVLAHATPVKLPLGDWTALSASPEHVLALRDESATGDHAELWSWGRQGALGYEDQTGWSDNLVPARVGTATGWAVVAAGGGAGSVNSWGGFSLAADRTGRLYAWGNNDVHQLGLGAGDTLNHAAPTLVLADGFQAGELLAAGEEHAMALVAPVEGEPIIWHDDDGEWVPQPN